MGVGSEVGGDVGQRRLLVEVVANHLRHVAVHGLVVGDSRADGIGQGHPPLPVDLEQPRHAQHGVGAEGGGVQEVVVYPSVDHVDLLPSLGRPHPHAAVLDVEVASLHELDTHLLGEEGVLEVRAVVLAGGEHDDGRLLQVARREAAQGLEKGGGVMLDRPHTAPLEEAGKGPRHDHAVGQHVADPARRAQVVLQHHVPAVLAADDVDAAHVRVHVVGQLDAVDLAAEVGIAQHESSRYDAVVEDPRLVVDVAQEEIEGAHPLDQSRLEPGPLVGGDHPRAEIQGKRPLRARFVAVHGEGDALVAKGQVGEGAAAAELDGRERPDALDDVGIVQAGRAVGLEDLVEEALGVVVAEHRPSSAGLAPLRRHRCQRERASRLSGAPVSRVWIHSLWSRAPIRR